MFFGSATVGSGIWFGIMVLMTVGFGMLAPPEGVQRIDW
jgi:TRAP-type C4-dicarboxylate transport system permease large subunit